MALSRKGAPRSTGQNVGESDRGSIWIPRMGMDQRKTGRVEVSKAKSGNAPLDSILVRKSTKLGGRQG